MIRCWPGLRCTLDTIIIVGVIVNGWHFWSDWLLLGSTLDWNETQSQELCTCTRIGISAQPRRCLNRNCLKWVYPVESSEYHEETASGMTTKKQFANRSLKDMILVISRSVNNKTSLEQTTIFDGAHVFANLVLYLRFTNIDFCHLHASE